MANPTLDERKASDGAVARISRLDSHDDDREAHQDLGLGSCIEPSLPTKCLHLGSTETLGPQADLGLRVEVTLGTGLSSREKHESLRQLELRQEREDWGLSFGCYGSVASRLLEQCAGLGSHPLELGCLRGSRHEFERTGIGQEQLLGMIETLGLCVEVAICAGLNSCQKREFLGLREDLAPRVESEKDGWEHDAGLGLLTDTQRGGRAVATR
ncbi:hypothetical protein TorRG33x02_217550 [Trema orientale]|uniref:Uncharacterized protein n=1 Tax=Trema orientale TaxID=63057 RepID=A0A2P5EAJ5_TREOI|nr:hypothetical protein TorRG33x02_217550 [Trema orientale]